MQKKKEIPKSIIVTIGTGTSMVLKDVKTQHLGGSAIGGGFFMGLMKILLNITDFNEALDLAIRGNRYNVDLKVSDIYDSEDDRVDLLFREFTAAAFGKIIDLENYKREDIILSIICLIGENIGKIACLMAEKNNVNEILFGGGFLKENRVLRIVLTMISNFNKKKWIFLRNSEFCSAIGALIF